MLPADRVDGIWETLENRGFTNIGKSDSIVIYWKQNCPHCDRAKGYLNANGYKYETIELGVEQSVEYFKMLNPGISTVPAIFINSKYMGGADELSILLTAERD